MATALDCRRGRTITTTSASARAHSGVAWQPTGAASVLAKSRARELREAGELPDPHDLLTVHAVPGDAEEWTFTLRINFAKKAAEERVYSFRKDAARLDDEGAFAAAFVFVAGPGTLTEGGFPYIRAVDVTEGAGHAPTVDVAGFGAGPTTILLGAEAPAPGQGEEPGEPEPEGNLLECVCFPGPTFEFDRSFIRPEVVDTLQSVDAALTKHPAARLFVVGHTDRVGDEQYNKDLSDRRAYSTFCFITDDAAGWELLYTKEGWGLKTVQVILADLGHDPGPPDGIMGSNTRRAMCSFLGVPEGTPVQNDAPFREKLFLAYMTGKHDVKATPDQFMSTRFTGCGEFNPIVPPNAAELANTAPGNEPNRRVVLYLFKEDEAVVPCQPHEMGPCKAEIAKPGERRYACAFYDSIATRCRCEGGDDPPPKEDPPPHDDPPPQDEPPAAGKAKLRVRVIQNGDQTKPFAGAQVALWDSTREKPAGAWNTGANGWVYGIVLDPGRYSIQVDPKRKGWSKASQPIELAEGDDSTAIVSVTGADPTTGTIVVKVSKGGVPQEGKVVQVVDHDDARGFRATGTTDATGTVVFVVPPGRFSLETSVRPFIQAVSVAVSDTQTVIFDGTFGLPPDLPPTDVPWNTYFDETFPVCHNNYLMLQIIDAFVKDNTNFPGGASTKGWEAAKKAVDLFFQIKNDPKIKIPPAKTFLADCMIQSVKARVKAVHGQKGNSHEARERFKKWEETPGAKDYREL